MMANVSDLVTRLRTRVGDNPPPEHQLAQVCETADVEEFIAQAVAEYSVHRPHTALRLLSLTSTATYDWPAGVMGITRMQIQNGRWLKEAVVAWDFLAEAHVRTGDFLLDMGYQKIVFLMATATDLTGTVIELHCQVVHTLPADAAAEAATPASLLDNEVDTAMLRAEALYRERLMDRLVQLAVMGDGSTENHELALKYTRGRIDELNREFQAKAPAAHLMRL